MDNIVDGFPLSSLISMNYGLAGNCYDIDHSKTAITQCLKIYKNVSFTSTKLLVKSPKLSKNRVAVYLETFSIFTHGFQIVYLFLLWLSCDAKVEQFTNATSHFIVLTFLQVCLMCWQLSITFGSRRMAVSFGGLCTKASKVFERMVVVVNGWVITTLDTGQDTTGYMAL